MKKLIGLVIVLCTAQAVLGQQKTTRQYFQMPEGITTNNYLAKTIIAKLQPEHRQAFSQAAEPNEKLAHILGLIQPNTIKPKFPYSQKPEQPKNFRGEKLVDLSLVYEFSYNGNIKLEQAINLLLSTGIFEYAEPHYVDRLLFTPNDPDLNESGQYFLNKLDAYNAWNIQQGDTNVTIGIIDTGTEVNHPDLQGNVKYNYDDPVNGIDDDADGYTDNFRGWDVGENNNDPQYNSDAHGVHVTGLAAASTNNNIGMASVGFKCKFLPVKITNANGDLTAGYEGITYAADMGCDIINCSWGSSFGSSLGQDVINYATFNQDALVVAACGNDGQETDFYPASYDNVISVTSTNTIDRKSNFANYGFNVDVAAPGESVYSTYALLFGGYTTSSGTSMASPVAAGAAAIIKSQFPNYTALQVGEVLRATTDFIDFTSGNNNWAGKLGTGRVNLNRALTETNAISVVMTDREITDGNDNAPVAEDTLNITGTFTNYLAPVNNLTVTLSSPSNFVDILNSTVSLGSLGTMGTADNSGNPFRVRILPTAPSNQDVDFTLTYDNGNALGSESFTIRVNVDYINIAVNDVATTITSRGKIGYNEPFQVEGLGFTYNDSQTLLYEAGLMIGTPNKVSATVRGATPGETDDDFASWENVHRGYVPYASDFDVEGNFNDNPAGSEKLDVSVFHQAYAWAETGYRKFVIVEYKITNTGSAVLNDLYAGIFADWDIMDYALNKADYDAANRMGYIWSTENEGLWAGIKLLSPGAATHYAIDNIDGGAGGINMFDGYSDADKYQSMSTNRQQAGSGSGNDVIHVVSSGPFSLAPDSSVIIGFALIAGEELTDLQTSAIAAQDKYDDDVPLAVNESSGTKGFQLFPNPANGQVQVVFDLMAQSGVEIAVFDISGKRITSQQQKFSAGKQRQAIDLSSFSPGTYFVRVITGNEIFVEKLILLDR